MLVALVPPGAGDRLAFDGLMGDLQARVVQGVRFPDEEPGGRYSSLQQELFNNIVVLGVVELLHRRRDDPAARHIVAALRRKIT